LTAKYLNDTDKNKWYIGELIPTEEKYTTQYNSININDYT